MGKSETKRDPRWLAVQPEIYKFESPGDAIEGVFMSCEPRDLDSSGKQVMGARYYLQTEAGPRMIWGAAVLDSQMKFLVAGSEVRVEFQGLGTAKPGQSAPQLLSLFPVPPSEEDSLPV